MQCAGCGDYTSHDAKPDSLCWKCERIEEQEAEIIRLQALLGSRPTQWAYDQACEALHHWRAEAERLARSAGDVPRQMQNS